MQEKNEVREGDSKPVLGTDSIQQKRRGVVVATSSDVTRTLVGTGRNRSSTSQKGSTRLGYFSTTVLPADRYRQSGEAR